MNTCQTCHQPTDPKWYFCPNCGAKLQSAPLSTSLSTQIGIYAFSLILPVICFLFVTKWPGMKYFRSKDPQEKQIGTTAWIILVASTIVTIWIGYQSYIWTVNTIQDSINQVNLDTL